MKKLIIGCAVVGLLLLVGGGVGGYFVYQSYLKPAVAFETARLTMEDFRSSEFDMSVSMNMYMDFSGNIDGLEDMEINYSTAGTGLIDVDGKKMKMKLTQGVGEESVTLDYVVIGDDVYVIIDGVQYDPSEYSSLGLDDFVVFYEDIKDNQVWDDLRSGVGYEFIGKEKINNVDVYHYTISLEGNELGRAFVNSFTEEFIAGFNSESDGSFAIDDNDVKISDITFDVWVRQDNNKPYKEVVNVGSVNIDLSSFAIRLEDVKTEFTYKSVNDPVKIEAPTK